MKLKYFDYYQNYKYDNNMYADIKKEVLIGVSN